MQAVQQLRHNLHSSRQHGPQQRRVWKQASASSHPRLVPKCLPTTKSEAIQMTEEIVQCQVCVCVQVWARQEGNWLCLPASSLLCVCVCPLPARVLQCQCFPWPACATAALFHCLPVYLFPYTCLPLYLPACKCRAWENQFSTLSTLSTPYLQSWPELEALFNAHQEELWPISIAAMHTKLAQVSGRMFLAAE